MNARKYAVYGALFGCFFPLAGTLFQAGMLGGGGSMGERIGQVQAMPLMWIIDTAPFFLGLFASLAGYLAAEETMASTQRVASEAQFLNDLAHRLDRSVRRAPADDALPAAALALPA